ncbi:hypothetical protein LTS09_014275 [Friedmanniomyces endolithicus]|nr:hypothetical protein LTS09_014275 [Friedmanniomyces endolithicus]
MFEDTASLLTLVPQAHTSEPQGRVPSHHPLSVSQHTSPPSEPPPPVRKHHGVDPSTPPHLTAHPTADAKPSTTRPSAPRKPSSAAGPPAQPSTTKPAPSPRLAGGRAGYGQQPTGGDETAPKPVTAAEKGTVLVSGYSQGQLKMFLENGQFIEPEEEVTEQDGEEGDEVIVEKVKPKEDPLTVVKRAIGHDAYRMLKVVD